jgi:flagellin-like protein
MHTFPTDRKESPLRIMILKIRRFRKAVSPILAVLLMIAIAIIAAIVAYMWIMGYIRFTTNKAGKAIQIQSVAHTGTYLLVYVQNVGDGSVKFIQAECLYVDGLLQAGAHVHPIDWVKNGEIAQIDSELAVTLGQTIKIKVVTDDGTFAEGTFTITQFSGGYTLSVNILGSGSVSRDPDKATYLPGTAVTLTANPADGWSFSAWSGGLAGSDNPATITIDGDITVNAMFTPFEYTLDTSVDPIEGGTVLKDPDKPTYHYGDAVQLTASSYPGYAFAEWTGDLTGSSNPAGITVNGNMAVTAHFTQLEYTLTVNVEGQGSVSRDNPGPYHYYDLVRLNATAEVGWSFSGWSGGFTGNPTTVAISGDQTVTAYFTENEYTLDITVEGSGNVSKNPDQSTYHYGDTVQLAANAATGWSFSAWNGDLTGTTNPDSILVDGNKAVTATFIINEYNLSVSFAGTGTGKVNDGVDHTSNYTQTCTYGTVVQLIPTADVSSDFIRWAGDGAGSPTRTVTMDSDKTVEVTFSLKQFTLTPSAGDNGSISPSTPVIANSGSNQTFTFDHDVGYHVADVLVDSFSIGTPDSYDFTNVTANHTIHVEFAIDTFTIIASAGPNGTITPVGSVTVNYGADQAFVVKPDTGYHVLDVIVDGTSLGAQASYTFPSVTANHTISASFEINTYVINTFVGPGGSIDPTGPVTVAYGADQSFNITASLGYHIDNVVVDGELQGPISFYTFRNVTSSHQIWAGFAIDTFTITASTGAGGSIVPSGDVVVNYGSNQTFTINANVGYHVSNVLVDGGLVGAQISYSFNFTSANHTISALFAQDEYTLTVNIVGSGIVSKNPDYVTYHYGDVVQLTANASVGWSFSGWSGNLTGSTNPASITVTGNMSVTATFVAFDHFTITGYPTAVTAGQSFGGVIVTAYDSNNNVMTSYTGQVYFTSTDTGADLPYTATSRYTFTSADNGVHMFAGFTLNTAGSRTITVTDGTKSATTNAITVTSPSYRIDYNTAISPTSATTGSSVTFTYTITRESSYDNLGWASIQVPAGFTAISVTSATYHIGSSSGSWDYTVSNNTIIVHDHSGTHELQSSGNYVVVVFSATTPSSPGMYGPFTSTVYENYNKSGSGPGTLDGSDPTVVVYVLGVLDHFTITGYPSSTTAGQNFDGSNVVVRAYDGGNNILTDYTGQVYFVSTDSQAILPYTAGSKYTFVSGDNGVHTFAGTGFTLKTAGSQTITVTDGSVSATSSSITVNPNAASKLVYTAGTNQTLITGQVSSVITVERQDQYGNPTTTGSITVNLTSSSGTGRFYSNSGGTTQITTRTISGGSSSANFYFGDTTAGMPTLTASSGSLTPAITQFTIQVPKANPDIASSFTPHSGIQPGNQVIDTAKLVNATADAGGSFTYKLYSGIYPSGTQIDSDTKTVTNGLVPDSKAFTVSTQGPYYFIDEYSGDSKNNGMTTYSPESFVAWPSAQTVLLRPSGDTSDNHLGTYGASTHYQCVNQVSPDGDTTYVYAITTSYWTDDTYDLPNLGFTSGTINYITIHAVARTTGYGLTQLSLTTHGHEYDGSENPGYPFPLTPGWLEYTAVWATNPSTGTTWTIQEINDLLVGCSLYENTGDARCTQVYIEIYYTPPVSITITSNPSGQGFIIVDGNAITTPTTFNWTQGSTHSLQANSPVADGTGIRYVYTSWSDSGAQTHSYTVPSSSTTITANYKTQYRLQVTSTRDSPTPPVGDNWYDPGTLVTASVTSPADQSGGTRYRCVGWSGTGSVPSSGTSTSVPFTVSAPSTITWNWVTQYRVTFGQTGLDGTATGTVVTVDGSPKSYVDLSFEEWVDSGTPVTYSYASPVSSSVSGKQFRLNSITGPSSTIIVLGATTVTGNYVTQYQIAFAVSPLGSGTTNPSGTNWYDAGSLSISATAESGYGFSSWSASGSITFANPSQSSTTATISGSGTITATFTQTVTVTLLDDGFEEKWDSTNWDRQTDQQHGGSYSINSDYYNDGYLTSSNINAQAATSITVSFWYRHTNIDSSDLVLYYYDGSNWDSIASLGNTGSDDTWAQYTQTITDSQYFKSNFRIRFYANLGYGENVWIDDVEVAVAGGTGTTFGDDFELSNAWNAHWMSSNWYQSSTVHSGSSSAESSSGSEGSFTCNNLDASHATSITVSFYYRLDDTEATDLILNFYDGTSYDFVANVGGGSYGTWLYYTTTITDSQYFKSNFRIQFVSNLDYGENVWIDDVLITAQVTP